MINEIGSEFWTQHAPAKRSKANNEEYLLSGRTALRFIIDDISKTRTLRKVLLPSYCCESMIQPFADSKIPVAFYPVNLNSVEYPYDNDADVVLLIDCFGYANPQNIEIARAANQDGKIVIYDATHKLNGNREVQKYADYTFCSYRKWFYCNFAQAIKHNGTFHKALVLTPNNAYTDMRNRAAHTKQAYMEGSTSQKECFLSDFLTAEQMLDGNYAGYSGEPVDFDIREIISKRRENAAYLIKALQKLPNIQLWQETIQQTDAPLFVPIFVDPLERSSLRNTLIKEKIYCPIHWPKSAHHGKCNRLYDTELSLVCDQRYNLVDMERTVQVIKDYFDR